MDVAMIANIVIAKKWLLDLSEKQQKHGRQRTLIGIKLVNLSAKKMAI